MILFNSHAECVLVVKQKTQRICVVGNITGLSTENYSGDSDHGKYTPRNIKLKLYKVTSWTDGMCFIPLQKLGNLNQSLGKANRSSECLAISSAVLDRNRTAENSFFLVHTGFC